LSGLFDWTFGSIIHSFVHPDDRTQGDSEDRISEAIERAVDRVQPRLRLVSDYRERLRPAVVSALRFIDETVEKIPGSLDINPKTFATDPRVNALFASVDHLYSVCRESAELRAFFEGEQCENLENCWALLCMRKTEKTVFGASMYGDVLRRDVRQITVSFSEHRFYSPSASEADARDGLKRCLYKSLIERAAQRLSECKSSLMMNDAKRRSLGARLRQIESARALGDNAPNEGLDAELMLLENQFHESEEHLREFHCAGPDECIDVLSGVLSHPEEHMRLHQFLLRIDRMGVKIDDPTISAEEIPLAEMELGGADKRVVLLARLPHVEFGPVRDLLSEAGRYLGV